MKFAWLSDIHLNFLSPTERRQFFDDLAKHDVDGWVVTGDIGEADSIQQYLADFACLPARTFFVLGNHDFYGGSIARVSADVAALSGARQQLTWLTNTGYAKLNPDVAIVGDDGWSDGRLGNPMTTPIMLNDFRLIEELTGLSRCRLVQRLQELGDQAAARLRPKLQEAASQYANVVILTHAPPFEGACWHEGHTSSPDWLPWFACAAIGDAISEAATAHPSTQFLVLCGHTHSAGRYAPRSNVVVHTAAADYGRPVVHGFLELGSSGVDATSIDSGLRLTRK